jgi:hypothetical protein
VVPEPDGSLFAGLISIFLINHRKRQ